MATPGNIEAIQTKGATVTLFGGSCQADTEKSEAPKKDAEEPKRRAKKNKSEVL